MVDIHTHILPSIDDGAKSEEESLAIIKKAKQMGITDIFLTPHYIVGSSYKANNKKKEDLIKALSDKVEGIHLYIGNEIYFDRDMLSYLKKGEMATLNHSKYLLFELPMHQKVSNLFDIIFELKAKGYLPILAHPERYSFIEENPIIVEKIILSGVLLQSNLGSIKGYYGKKVQKTVQLLLKHHMISFLSSDIHHEENSFYDDLPSIEEELTKFLEKSYIEALMNKNATAIIKNKPLETPAFIPLKKGLFGYK